MGTVISYYIILLFLLLSYYYDAQTSVFSTDDRQASRNGLIELKKKTDINNNILTTR